MKILHTILIWVMSLFYEEIYDVDDPDSIMTLEEWISDVENLIFTDDDGWGYFSDGLFYYPKRGVLYPSNVDCIEEDANEKGFTHVYWINK